MKEMNLIAIKTLKKLVAQQVIYPLIQEKFLLVKIKITKINKKLACLIIRVIWEINK